MAKLAKAKNAPKILSKEIIPQFPTKILKCWLEARSSWTHEDWLQLLETLGAQGYSYWTESQERKDQIGSYLEQNRKI